MVAAAGPALRRALGKNWRGKFVLVSGVQVKLVDWCQCYKGTSKERIIDLHPGVFAKIGPLSRGVLRVKIRW